jgi:hypothetical protein
VLFNKYTRRESGIAQGSAGFGHWQKKTFPLDDEEVEVFGGCAVSGLRRSTSIAAQG